MKEPTTPLLILMLLSVIAHSAMTGMEWVQKPEYCHTRTVPVLAGEYEFDYKEIEVCSVGE